MKRSGYIANLVPDCSKAFTRLCWKARSSALDIRLIGKGPINIKFDGMVFEKAFKIDLLVDHRLVIEIKSVEQFSRAHMKQLHTYLRLINQPVGLLLNFSAATMKEGIHRVVNDHRPGS